MIIIDRLFKPALYALLAFVACANAAGNISPAGKWKTIADDGKSERGEIEISITNGILTAKVLRVLKPGVPPAARCIKCTDDRKNAPLVGLEVIRNVRQITPDGLTWGQGEILDPESGQVYRVEMKPSEDGKEMKVHGYIGIPLLGRTQVWRRAE